jgi:hypothetical protein
MTRPGGEWQGPLPGTLFGSLMTTRSIGTSEQLLSCQFEHLLCSTSTTKAPTHPPATLSQAMVLLMPNGTVVSQGPYAAYSADERQASKVTNKIRYGRILIFGSSLLGLPRLFWFQSEKATTERGTCQHGGRPPHPRPLRELQRKPLWITSIAIEWRGRAPVRRQCLPGSLRRKTARLYVEQLPYPSPRRVCR